MRKYLHTPRRNELTSRGTAVTVPLGKARKYVEEQAQEFLTLFGSIPGKKLRKHDTECRRFGNLTVKGGYGNEPAPLRLGLQISQSLYIVSTNGENSFAWGSRQIINDDVFETELVKQVTEHRPVASELMDKHELAI